MLDATLKEIAAALLESDVNVKLVATLRQKVKAKVKGALEGSGADKSKETNRKHIQKVGRVRGCSGMLASQASARPFSMS